MLISSNRNPSNSVNHKNDLTQPAVFNYAEFERDSNAIGMTAEQAIYEYFYQNCLSKLPYYTKKKNEFDQRVADDIELGINRSGYSQLLGPAIKRQRATANLRVTEKEFGSTDPQKIADLFSRLNPQ